AYRKQKKAGYEADKWELIVVNCQPDGTFDGEPKSVTEKLDRSVDGFAWLGDTDLLFNADHLGGTAIVKAAANGSEIRALPGRGMYGSISCSMDGQRYAYAKA